MEYESAVRKTIPNTILSNTDIGDFVDYICSVSNHLKIYFLWRPFLKDPKDDMVLELAVASQSRYIITYNTRHFNDIEQFGIKAVTPLEFLKKIGEIL